MIIETDGLTKKYKDKTAVNSINLSVEKGSIYGFLGPNGAGKSTCIKMLTGLVYPTSGKGSVLGHPLGAVRVREKMGYLPEMFRYHEWMTGEDLLNFHSNLFKLKRDKERNKRVLNRVGLVGQEKYKVGSYSKGMQQRLGLACALLPEPELLFLDEPTSALDPIGRKDVRDIILSLQNEGTTIFLNSHLLSEVETVCDYITIINKGVVVKSGAIKELLTEKSSLEIVCSNVTDETVNLLKERFGEVTCQQDKLSIQLHSREDIPEITSLLVAKGLRIYELKAQHETLESMFLKLVGEGEEISER